MWNRVVACQDGGEAIVELVRDAAEIGGSEADREPTRSRLVARTCHSGGRNVGRRDAIAKLRQPQRLRSNTARCIEDRGVRCDAELRKDLRQTTALTRAT